MEREGGIYAPTPPSGRVCTTSREPSVAELSADTIALGDVCGGQYLAPRHTARLRHFLAGARSDFKGTSDRYHEGTFKYFAVPQKPVLAEVNLAPPELPALFARYF